MKKFEKITLITAVQSHGTTNSVGITALDHIVPTLEKYLSADVTLIDYDIESEYELVEKTNE